jgi:glycosidase
MKMNGQLNPKLYEINTLVWLGELSRRYGKTIRLGNVPAEQWDRLKLLGFDYVWLMGVWKRSREGVKLFKESPEWPKLCTHFDAILPGWTDEDVTGSPYSIAAYTPEPGIGTWSDLDKARAALKKRGMRLILDFVPNHTAPDHPWTRQNPDYYIQGGAAGFRDHPESSIQAHKGKKTLYIARGKDPNFPPWPDTAQLNYFNPAMRSALIGELITISEHCDGVRCDMAMLVLNDIFSRTWGWARKDPQQKTPEFWEEVRRALPGFLLIAEAYWDTEWRLQQLGFDYVYDKRLYDRLLNASGKELNLHLTADPSYQDKLVRFIENHDEARSAAVFDSGKLRAAVVLYSLLPGMKLYHHGQLVGRKIHIPLLLGRAPDEQSNENLKAFYEKVLSISQSEIFRYGEWRLHEVIPAEDGSFVNLIAYQWKKDGQLKLVVVNLGSGYAQGRIALKQELSADSDYSLVDELNDRSYVRAGKDMAGPGLHVVLGGYQSHILGVKQAS